MKSLRSKAIDILFVLSATALFWYGCTGFLYNRVIYKNHTELDPSLAELIFFNGIVLGLGAYAFYTFLIDKIRWNELKRAREDCVKNLRNDVKALPVRTSRKDTFDLNCTNRGLLLVTFTHIRYLSLTSNEKFEVDIDSLEFKRTAKKGFWTMNKDYLFIKDRYRKLFIQSDYSNFHANDSTEITKIFSSTIDNFHKLKKDRAQPGSPYNSGQSLRD